MATHPASARQRARICREIDCEVLERAATLHTQLGREYLRAGMKLAANTEAERARRARIRSKLIERSIR